MPPDRCGAMQVRVTVIDRHNYHLFQPLLYQVATGALSPANIAAPLRGLLARQENTEVLWPKWSTSTRPLAA